MEPRKVYRCGKPTVCTHWQAVVLSAFWRGCRTPPGSESGACLYRGNSGTWESHLAPCHRPGMEDRVTKGPGVVWGLRPDHEPVRDNTNEQKWARYRGTSDKRRTLRGSGGSRSVA